MLGNLSVETVLDISTGKGQFIGFLDEYLGGYHELTGIDPDTESLSEAVAAGYARPNIKLLSMRAQQLTFPDDSFSMATLSRGLHHLAGLPLCLAEIRRVLHKQGYFLINEMYADVESEAEKNAVLLHHMRADIDQLLHIDHFHTFTRRELQEIPARAGFELVRIIDFQPENRKTSEELYEDAAHHLDRIKDYPEHSGFQAQLEGIRIRIEKYGTDTPRHLLMLCRKS